MVCNKIACDGLVVSDVSFQFGAKKVLEDVNLTVAPGEFKVLLGPNGAGKTTLFSLITRLFATPTGKISISGFDIAKQSSRAMAQFGVVFQQSTLDLDLSVAQNLYYHGALHGMSRSHAKARTQVELERLHMLERLNEKVRNLNGGHRRRVEIARALLHQPKMLLLDEPTIGLDPTTRAEIVSYIHDLTKSDGVSVLWATHLVDEVLAHDSVILLHQGRVQVNGIVEDVLRQGNFNDIQAAFFALTASDRPASRGGDQ